jgi:lysophospholipase L1-like esterase
VKNLLALAAGMVAALILAEVLTRLFVPVRDVGPLFTANDPLMGKRIKKNLRTVRTTPEFTMRFTSNSLGFRGPEPASAHDGSVVFVGDSFTMGFGVNDGEEFPALIRARLQTQPGKAPDVVNTGMGNSGNGRWVKFLRHEAERFKPRLVVLQVSSNDFTDNVSEDLFRLSDSGALEERPVKLSRMKTLEAFVDVAGISQSHFYSFARQVLAHAVSGSEALVSDHAPAAASESAYADRLTERLIGEALSLCAHNGYATFVILVGLEGERLERMQSMLAARRVSSLVAPSKSERPDLYFRIDGHWNAAGHAFVAEALFRQLRSLDLI